MNNIEKNQWLKKSDKKNTLMEDALTQLGTVVSLWVNTIIKKETENLKVLCDQRGIDIDEVLNG